MDKLTPEQVANRTVRVEKHYYHYYGPRYDYYRSQPYIYVGGGYTPIFWYAMLDWDLERRAAWLYHHQNDIDRALYEKQLENAALKAEIAKIKKPIDPAYVDKDFRENPDAMYDDAVVQARWQSKPIQEPVQQVQVVQQAPQHADGAGWSFWRILLWTILIGGIVALVVWLVFIKDWQIK